MSPCTYLVKAPTQVRAGNGATELSVTEKECAGGVPCANSGGTADLLFALSKERPFGLGDFYFATADAVVFCFEK